MSRSVTELYEFGPFRLDVTQHLLTRAEETVPLAPKTFQLLLLLIQSGGRALSKQELMSALWPDTFVEEANLSFQMSTLRKALGAAGAEWIQTVPKYGYRFAAEVKLLPGISPPRGGTRRNKTVLTVVSIAAIISAVLYTALSQRSSTDTRRRGAAATVTPLTSYPGFEEAPTLSPDGSQVAFSWNGPNQDNDDIYVKLVGPGDPKRLTTDPARDDNPAWSPDGRWIAFQRAVTDETADIFVVPALGGAERKVARINIKGRSLWSPSRLSSSGNLSWAPDVQWIAFGGRPSPEETAGIWLVSIDRPGERHRLTTSPGTGGDWEPAFSHDGRRLAFVRERTLSATALHVLPLTPDLMPDGAPFKVTPDNALARGFAWAPGDTALVFSWSTKFGISHLHRVELPATRMDGGGEPELLPFGEGTSAVSISSNGRLVYATQFRDTNMWQLPLAGPKSGLLRLVAASTFDEGVPDVSPVGNRLAFASTRSGTEEIWMADADGSNAVQLTTMRGPTCSNPKWSPDGSSIVFNSRSQGSSDLYLLQRRTGELRRVTTDPGEEIEPRWSRDGHWIYFASNKTGAFEGWKMPADGGAWVQITRSGGLTPAESPDGRFLYYAKNGTSPTSIWRVPPGGGEESPVVAGLSHSMNLVVATRGLYFVAVSAESQQASIDFYEYATKKRTTLLTLNKRWWYGMAISPDQQWLLYSNVDSAGSNLMSIDYVHK